MSGFSRQQPQEGSRLTVPRRQDHRLSLRLIGTRGRTRSPDPLPGAIHANFLIYRKSSEAHYGLPKSLPPPRRPAL